MNEIDEIAQESKRYVNAPKPAPAAGVLPQAVDISRPYEQRIGSAPVSNPNVQGGLLSAEAADYQAARGAAPNHVAGAAPQATPASPAAVPRSPIMQAAQNAGQKFTQAAGATLRAQVPPLPSASGAIGRLASGAASGIGSIATKAAPFIAPAIEAGRVAQVAADPNTTKGQVVQQAVEGTARWGAAAGGAALGAGLGAMTGPAAPVLGPVGAVAGGVAGYYGGDAAINSLRSALGLGDKSPIQQVQDRNAQAAASAQAAQPAQAQSAAQVRTVPNPVAALAQQSAATAPSQQQTQAQPGSRIRAMAGQSAQPAPRSTFAAAPQQDDGTVHVIEGMDQFIEIPGVNGGPMRKVPLAVYNEGKTNAYLKAEADAGVNSANPEEAKTKSKLAEIAAENAGRLGVAGIGAASARYGTDANIAARKDELKNNVIYSDDTVTDEMGNSKVVRKAYKPDGTPITGSSEKKPALDVATRQAQNAISAGASKDAVNSILQGYGYPPIK